MTNEKENTVPQPSELPPMVEGKILSELFKVRERCLELGFTDEAIATSMRAAPTWFPALSEREASR